jgi:hypothetical protein
MARSRIKNFRSRALASPGDLTSVLIRLMFAVNDISLAADANDFWAEATEPRRANRKNPARGYFVRLIMSHVYEALKLIAEIDRNSALRAAVDQCDAHTVQIFKELLNAPERRDHLYRFRNKTTFHYDKEVSAEHLQKVIAGDPNATWGYSVGSTPLDWRFELGDAVMDHIVVKYVLGADEPRSSARTEKIAQIATRLDQIATMFTDFATSFIERHSK